ncbi:hypothetical protein B0H14DRAFT_3613817 [Mycena olivaceomarginata]|nr:hypothetical protein B0H14DRAFT_3613817 [Mycena olivaceomarginata]
MQMDVDVLIQEFGPPDPDVEMRDVDAQIPRMMDVPDQDDGIHPRTCDIGGVRDSWTIRRRRGVGMANGLIKNVGHNQTETFLKLPIGVAGAGEHISLEGDLVDEDNQFKTEVAELWFRDPIECVKELIGNPVFKHVIDYAPSKLYDHPLGRKGSEVVNEMSSARCTSAPIILSSDKTRLSQFSGDKSAWPVYLTIGNINKDTRRKTSAHATILLGYLPVAKMDCYSDAARSVAKYPILRSLAEAGANGVDMTCADGMLRKVYPILAAYVDYPEQCLVACCMENRCPVCKVLPKERGDHIPCPKRDMDETLDYIHRFENEHHNAQFKQEFVTKLGLRPVPPFWAGLPHTDIFEAFTPDLLHQLHKGVFKDHLVSWCTAVTEGGEKEIDARFKSMPSHPDVRHFKNGLSMVSQWTGGEHKEMEKVFACLIAGHAAEPAVIRTAQAVIDFIYLASLESHTARSLDALGAALDTFHANKQIFLDLGVRAKQGHFNIPKLHSMEHYVAMIWLFGSLDGYNTESPERLHIDYAKAGYRASNKRDYIAK